MRDGTIPYRPSINELYIRKGASRLVGLACPKREQRFSKRVMGDRIRNINLWLKQKPAVFACQGGRKATPPHHQKKEKSQIVHQSRSAVNNCPIENQAPCLKQDFPPSIQRGFGIAERTTSHYAKDPRIVLSSTLELITPSASVLLCAVDFGAHNAY